MCTGCWEIREAVPQCLASCPLPCIHTPCDRVPGAPKSACRPFQMSRVKSNQLCWNNGSWTICPNLFTHRSLFPPSAGWLDFRSRSTSVLAIQCHLRSWIPMHETHFFSPVLFGVSYPNPGYQDGVKHGIGAMLASTSSQTYSDSRLRTQWTESRKRVFLLDL